MYACRLLPRAATSRASAWTRVRDLDGRPWRPCGTSHSSTTLRLTLSLAWARVIARLRTDRTSSSVRVLRILALSASHQQRRLRRRWRAPSPGSALKSARPARARRAVRAGFRSAQLIATESVHRGRASSSLPIVQLAATASRVLPAVASLRFAPGRPLTRRPLTRIWHRSGRRGTSRTGPQRGMRTPMRAHLRWSTAKETMATGRCASINTWQ